MTSSARLLLYCLAAFLFDWVLYILWTVIPIRAEGFGADPLHLAYLQTASSAVYVVSCLVVGRMSDRFSRAIFARLGCALMILVCLLVGWSRNYLALLLIAPLAGLASSLFWPPIQGAIGTESRSGTLERSIGLFNVLWSTGKGLGFLSAGAIHGGWGTFPTMALAASGTLAVFCFYPWRDARRESERPTDSQDPHRRSTFLRMAWIANFALFGIGAIIANQYFKFVEEHRLGQTLLGRFERPTEAFFGLYLGLVYLSQTAVFAILSRTNSWAYRRSPLYVTQTILAAAALTIPMARGDLLILATAPVVGLGLGFGYSSSIYYSLHTPRSHGKYSGIHEAVLGSGNFLLPLAAGALARGWGDLRWPYWFAAGCALLAIGIEDLVFRLGRHGHSRQ